MTQWLSERARRVPRRTMMIGLACGGAAVGIGGFAAVRRRIPGSDAFRKAEPHIKTAEKQSLDGIPGAVAIVDEFFSAAKSKTRSFAGDALGLYSKIAWVRGKHDKYLAARFRKNVFAPEDIEATVTKAVAAYLDDVEGIENEMLVNIRLDVAGLPSAGAIGRMSIDEFRDSFQRMSKQISARTALNVGSDVGKEIAAQIAGQVLVRAAARLGVSGGILTAGAASSWWTAGIGVAVALLIDLMVSTVWDWVEDPKGRLADEMNRKLEEIRRMIVDGDEETPGLRQELEKYAAQRAIVRRDVVRAMVAGS
jgi:hypothetical protein